MTNCFIVTILKEEILLTMYDDFCPHQSKLWWFYFLHGIIQLIVFFGFHIFWRVFSCKNRKNERKATPKMWEWRKLVFQTCEPKAALS